MLNKFRRGLLAVGIWPGRTTGLNLRKKWLRYRGNTDLYHRDVSNKRSFYSEDTVRQPEPASKSKMVPKPYGKYQQKPMMGVSALENSTLPDFVARQAYAHVSMSIAVTTAAQYKSAVNVIAPASEYLKRPINIPLTTEDCIALIVYMANVRGLKSSTIENYFSGFRMLHLIKGHYNHHLRADIVTQMIKGVKNGDQIKDMIQNKHPRQPVTVGIMAKLKESIHNAKMPTQHKRLIWFAATTCLLGSFRVHEVLPKEQHTYDKSITLMQGDIKFTSLKSNGKMTNAVTIHLKNPKEDKTTHGIRVDIFETTGPLRWLCAVNAALKYEGVTDKTDSEQPFARTANGLGYTGRMFNQDLKQLLMGKLDLSLGPLTSHSFRAGLATMMAKAGFPDKEIQLTGRWTSTAFKSYVKTARPKRAALAASIWNTLAESGVPL